MARRSAAAGSCSRAQARAWCMVASSASSHRAAVASPALVCIPASVWSATCCAYWASAAAAPARSPAPSSRFSPNARRVSSIRYRSRPSGPARGGVSSEQSTRYSTTGPAPGPATVTAASSVNGPGNTASLRNTR